MSFAKSYRFLGIASFWVGLLIGVIKAKRSVEVMHSIWCEILYRLKPVQFPTVSTGHLEVDSVFVRFIAGKDHLVARKQGVVRSANILIACEYGEPGARVLVRGGRDVKIFSPYLGDDLVWHIHAICHVIDDLYIVTTGDSRKYADLMRINLHECRILKRLFRRLGGFTAVINVDGHIWAGSDLSERVNYIQNITTGKIYFLPQRGFGTFVIDIVQERESLLILTKRLDFDSGYIFTFNIMTQKFTSGNSIVVNERFLHDAVLHEDRQSGTRK